jgi:hypothetical protein
MLETPAKEIPHIFMKSRLVMPMAVASSSYENKSPNDRRAPYRSFASVRERSEELFWTRLMRLVVSR